MLSDTASSFSLSDTVQAQSMGMTVEPGQRLPGAVILQTEPVRVLYRPLTASSASPAKSTCCSVGSLASTYSSSHLPSKGGVQPLSHPRRTEYQNKICAAKRELMQNHDTLQTVFKILVCLVAGSSIPLLSGRASFTNSGPSSTPATKLVFPPCLCYPAHSPFLFPKLVSNTRPSLTH